MSARKVRYTLYRTMQKLLTVEPRSDFRLYLKFEDGAEGVVDLSHLAGKGVFSIWNQPGEFEAVRITDDGAIGWGEEVDICPDALYLEITGQNPEDIFPAPRASTVNA